MNSAGAAAPLPGPREFLLFRPASSLPSEAATQEGTSHASPFAARAGSCCHHSRFLRARPGRPARLRPRVGRGVFQPRLGTLLPLPVRVVPAELLGERILP